MREVSTERPAVAELIATVALAVGVAAALAFAQVLASGIPFQPRILVPPCAVGAVLGTLVALRSARLRSMLRDARSEATALRLAEPPTGTATDHELRAEVAARDLLLREMHHRTKNNLQLVSSLISRQIEEHDSVGSLNRLLGRVHTIAIVHDQLNHRSNVDRIGLRNFLESVVTSVVRSLSPPTLAVIPDLALQDVELQMRDAAPLGLIVNELVTNSIEHGFTGRERGSIRLECTANNDELRIRYEDDGPGMPEALPDRETVGLSLVDDLVRQMQGRYRVRHGGPGFALDAVVPHQTGPADADRGGMHDRSVSATLTDGCTG